MWRYSQSFSKWGYASYATFVAVMIGTVKQEFIQVKEAEENYTRNMKIVRTSKNTT